MAGTMAANMRERGRERNKLEIAVEAVLGISQVLYVATATKIHSVAFAVVIKQIFIASVCVHVCVSGYTALGMCRS